MDVCFPLWNVLPFKNTSVAFTWHHTAHPCALSGDDSAAVSSCLHTPYLQGSSVTLPQATSPVNCRGSELLVIQETVTMNKMWCSFPLLLVLFRSCILFSWVLEKLCFSINLKQTNKTPPQISEIREKTRFSSSLSVTLERGRQHNLQQSSGSWC